MKKITFICLIFVSITFLFKVNAQTLNQNANWPNVNWTVTGTYNTDPLAFEADPTSSSNFAFDDDDAGNGNEDNIAAESPVIDLTAAHAAGETWLNVSVVYVYRFLANDELVFQYWDADSTSWVNWGDSFDDLGTDTTTDDNFCSGTSDTYNSPVLDISSFTPTQLSGFRYRISYDDDPSASDWNWGFCFESPTITSSLPITDTLDYFNLQWPPNGTVDITSPSFTVYAQAYEAGLTDVTSGQAPGIECWIGYNTTDNDPSNVEWTWVSATFNVEAGNNDEYLLDLGTNITSVGTYYYASRWRLNGGPYTYGGIQTDGSFGGTWGDNNNGSGVLTINPITNDDCAGAISLTAGGIYADNPQDGGSLTLATDSGYTNTCGGTGVLDVWYTVTVPASGNITIATEADIATGTTGCDTAIEVYTSDSDCTGTLTSIGCDDDGAATGAYSELILTSLTPGQTLYIRLWGYGDDETEPYSISAFDASLSTNDFESNTLFTFYPNPVKEKLSITSQEVVQEVTIYNMVGQRVVNTKINSVSPEIDLTNLKSGAYFVQVTINGVAETIHIIKQ